MKTVVQWEAYPMEWESRWTTSDAKHFGYRHDYEDDGDDEAIVEMATNALRDDWRLLDEAREKPYALRVRVYRLAPDETGYRPLVRSFERDNIDARKEAP